MSPAAAAAERVAAALKPLCEQQFWLFGFDTRRSEGNLLLNWGFERQRQTGGRPTRYLRGRGSLGAARARRLDGGEPCCSPWEIADAWEAQARAEPQARATNRLARRRSEGRDRAARHRAR